MNKEKIIEQITKIIVAYINKKNDFTIDDIEKLLDIICQRFSNITNLELKPRILL